jgi:hypothetical protein
MLARLLPISCAAATLGFMSMLTWSASAATNLPASGKVVSLVNGDLMCYVQLVDRRGKKHNLGADFAICENNKFLNKKVKLTYKRARVNDCQSAEPCGKSRWAILIVKMRVIK